MHEPLTHPKLIRDVLGRAIDQFNTTDAKALLKPGKNTGGPNEPAIGTQLITRIVDALRFHGVPEFVFAIGTYNRFGDDRKFLYKMEAYRNEIEAAKRQLDPEGKFPIFPDIIVHEFGAPGPNYLVAELKKDSNADKALVDLDHIKLSCMTSPDRPLQYILGAEIRAHDVADEQNRRLEVLSWWQGGSKVPFKEDPNAHCPRSGGPDGGTARGSKNAPGKKNVPPKRNCPEEREAPARKGRRAGERGRLIGHRLLPSFEKMKPPEILSFDRADDAGSHGALRHDRRSHACRPARSSR